MQKGEHVALIAQVTCKGEKKLLLSQIRESNKTSRPTALQQTDYQSEWKNEKNKIANTK